MPFYIYVNIQLAIDVVVGTDRILSWRAKEKPPIEAILNDQYSLINVR